MCARQQGKKPIKVAEFAAIPSKDKAFASDALDGERRFARLGVIEIDTRQPAPRN
jgi:hypothetical protein